MSEHWEKVIEHELDFLYNAPEYEADLRDRLKENEMNILYPVTQFDSEQGMIFRSCPGTEQQALRRIEVREAIEGLLEHLSKRINRLIKAISQLSEIEQDIISWVYIERDTPEKYIKSSLGFQSMKEYEDAKKSALSKLMKIFESEREAMELEYKKMQKEQRREIVRGFLGIAQ